MGSFMSKHSTAARERKALLGNMPVDNKASALNYGGPDDKKKPSKDASIEEKRAYLKSKNIPTYATEQDKDNFIAEVRRGQAKAGIKPEEGKFKEGSVDPYSGAKL